MIDKETQAALLKIDLPGRKTFCFLRWIGTRKENNELQSVRVSFKKRCMINNVTVFYL
jgi:hypothetical protein